MADRLRPPRRHGLIALLGVAALHLVLWSLLSRPASRPERRDAAPAPVALRLLPWTARAPERLAPRDAPVTRPPRPPAAISLPELPPVATGAVTSAMPAEAAPLPEPPASQAPPPLDLTLPRGYGLRPDTRNPVTQDTRANTARLTPEARMARSFDQQVTQERLGDGSLRLRQGADCVVVSPARTSQLFPIDPSAARAPGTAHECP